MSATQLNNYSNDNIRIESHMNANSFLFSRVSLPPKQDTWNTFYEIHEDIKKKYFCAQTV